MTRHNPWAFEPEPQSVGVDHDNRNGDLLLRVYDREHRFDATVVRIDAADVPTFLRDVANHAASALTDVVRALATGHCETCRNRHLVEEPVPGQNRTVSVHCPACGGGKSAAAAFEERPRMGDTEEEPDA